ncbi:MAG TPA: hypothetical protein GXZ43_06510 [Clostridiaceae bacterium]|nr:hypothetical protein [Clostridiaceae bacterium]
MKRVFILLLSVIMILSVGCERKSIGTNLKTVGDKVLESDSDFSNYKEIFSDYQGAKEITEFDKNVTAEIPVIIIGDYFCSVFFINNRTINSLSLVFYSEDNDLTVDELEEKLVQELKKAYPKLEHYEEIIKGKVYEGEQFSDTENGFSVVLTKYIDDSFYDDNITITYSKDKLFKNK